MSIKHVCVFGLVQGVGFRAYLAREAQKLGVTGWVRNVADGSVEAMLQSEDAALAKLIEWCRHGPRGARVERIETSDGEGAFAGFTILPTSYIAT